MNRFALLIGAQHRVETAKVAALASLERITTDRSDQAIGEHLDAFSTWNEAVAVYIDLLSPPRRH